MINMNEIFGYEFVKCHKNDKTPDECFDKVFEEVDEFYDAYEEWQALEKDFRNMYGVTPDELEEAEKEAIYELMDVIQASVTMLGYLKEKKELTDEHIKGWLEKQNKRKVEYNVG